MYIDVHNTIGLGLVVLALGCGPASTGPQKFPVTGTVLINGKPAERVAVQFHHSNSSTPGNLRYPTAVTDGEGRFQLSSEGEADGAVEGEYTVTFTWLSSPDLDAFDMLQGALSDPQKSSHRVKVPVEQETLEPFSLTIPETQIRRPKQS